jgi:UDP-N-acetylmuramoylalanine--D-glutamate ligase
MFVPDNKRVLVVGLGASGVAASELLRARGARVTAVDNADTAALRSQAQSLRALGVETLLGQALPPDGPFDLVVLSPGVPAVNPLVREVARRGVPVISELELGWQQSYCASVAITGTNGKTTTTELVERMLAQNHLQTLAAGNIGLPLCAVASRTRELDYLTLEVSSFQLETIEHFRPALGVLMNITPDHLDRYDGMESYARAKGRLFMNQQPFDRAIIQSEALARLRDLGVTIPSKVITFSATDRTADLCLDRSLLLSRLPDWPGPLLDMARCRLQGPHNAENLMAALAVGRALRLPLEGMVEALCSYQPAPHRCERVAEIGGVSYVNDSKATNLDAVAKALLTMPAGPDPGRPNVWLLAGGKDKGFEFHDIGPLLSQRVKGAFVFGETREKIRAAWSLFTSCALVGSLLEGFSEAAKQAVSGDVVLLSPACSSFDQFQNYQQRGDVFRQAVQRLAGPRSQDSAHQPENAPGAGAPAARPSNEPETNSRRDLLRANPVVEQPNRTSERTPRAS